MFAVGSDMGACYRAPRPEASCVEAPATSTGRSAETAREDLLEAFTRPHLGAEASQVVGLHLAVDELEAPHRELPDEAHEGHLRGVRCGGWRVEVEIPEMQDRCDESFLVRMTSSWWH